MVILLVQQQPRKKCHLLTNIYDRTQVFHALLTRVQKCQTTNDPAEKRKHGNPRLIHDLSSNCMLYMSYSTDNFYSGSLPLINEATAFFFYMVSMYEL